ncbi:MAG: amidohydrolase family protein, partial [Chloroflexota bacterium]
MDKWILKGNRVVLPEGESSVSLVIAENTIESIEPHDFQLDNLTQTTVDVVDVEEAIIMPGLIDLHVHINEPGRTEWEGFDTATQAAAAGGITTLVDMPLNSSPVTTTTGNFQKKLDAASGKLVVDVAYHAGVIPEHVDHLDQVLEMGAIAGKAFMIDSGIDDFPFADRETLREAMLVLKKHNKPLLA